MNGEIIEYQRLKAAVFNHAAAFFLFIFDE
jgi:hypothetical protein